MQNVSLFFHRVFVTSQCAITRKGHLPVLNRFVMKRNLYESDLFTA